jgi:hypothetical protein
MLVRLLVFTQGVDRAHDDEDHRVQACEREQLRDECAWNAPLARHSSSDIRVKRYPQPDDCKK